MLRSLLLLTALLVPWAPALGQEMPEYAESVRWFDLLTEDAAAASTFYGQLFGWDVQRVRPGRYVVVHDGEQIAGISEIERTLPNLDESTWLIGVVVEDLSAAVATARRLGGEILQDVTPAEDLADWAVIEDPDGGQLLLIQPTGLRQFDREPGVGHLVWTELWTHDVEASSSFYTEVVGWERNDREHPDGEYPLFHTGGEPRAGLVQIESSEIETGWAPYIAVEDLEDTMARARGLGGTVILEPTPEIYDGLVAILRDPTGVGFLIYQFPEEGGS